MKRWPEVTPWKDSKTWKIYSKILKKLLNLKKKKKVFKDLRQKRIKQFTRATELGYHELSAKQHTGQKIRSSIIKKLKEIMNQGFYS